jgi:hypothetical protein
MQSQRPRKLTGRIISFGAPSLSSATGEDSGEMPFRPAYDLLEQQEAKPTGEELAAIALAVFALTANESQANLGRWGQAGIFESAGRGSR